MHINQPKAAKGFTYSDAPQRSPEWVSSHVGRVGASQLHRWMAVSKRADKDGNYTPLKARIDYEREIAFEKAFGVPFSHFTSDAMQAGIDNEDFVRDQYSSAQGVPVEKCGAFFNDHFIASPDGLVGDDGLVEIKWLFDTSWTEVVATGKPYAGASGDHYLQMQGQLWASGRKWVDYIVANGNTGRFKVIRIERDEDTIQRIAASVPDVANIEPLSTDGVFEFTNTVPVSTEPVIFE